ncbi:MAG: hypothetical protein WAT18_01295, partial [Sphingorhabdus sp.]
IAFATSPTDKQAGFMRPAIYKSERQPTTMFTRNSTATVQFCDTIGRGYDSTNRGRLVMVPAKGVE